MSCAERIHVADWGQMMMAQERPNPLAQAAIRFTRSRNMLIIVTDWMPNRRKCQGFRG